MTASLRIIGGEQHPFDSAYGLARIRRQTGIRMLATRLKPHVNAATRRAMNAVGPAKAHHGRERAILVREVPDGFHQGAGGGVFHEPNPTERRLLSQVYYYLG